MADTEVDLNRLCSAVQSARMVKRHMRDERRAAVLHYAGGHWLSEGMQREKTFINLLDIYVNIVLRNLIAKTPRVMLSTFDRASKPAVSAMEKWVNKEIDDAKLANTLQRICLDALFSIAICKVSLATPSDAAIGAWGVGAGEPIAQRVDPDDFVCDVHARDFSEVSFIGHRYRAPIAVIKDSNLYDKSRKDLVASTDPRFNQEGDERINVLGRGYYGNDDELEDMVDLWEICCPRHKCIYTLAEDCLTGVMAPAHGGTPVALRHQDWLGRRNHPYEILGFGMVPGNLLPKGPIMGLVDMHISINRILRKLIWSAENMKDVLAITKGSDGDMERIRDSMHGGILPLDRPKDMTMVTMNMPNNMLFQVFVQLKDMFSWMAGNLDIMGGLSGQTKTAKQDAMLNENATKGIADMQDRTITFTAEVIKSLCWYYWHDPKRIMKSVYSPQGLPEIQVPLEVQPWNSPDPMAMKRDGNWDDLDIKVDPYSLGHSTPQQRAGDLIQTVKEIYAPLAQVFMSQGIGLDLNTFLDKLGAYRDMPDLKEIMAVREPVQMPTSAPEQPAPDQTTHIRENMPGRTRQGNDMNLMNALAGVDGGGSNGKPKEVGSGY